MQNLVNKYAVRRKLTSIHQIWQFYAKRPLAFASGGVSNLKNVHHKYVSKFPAESSVTLSHNYHIRSFCAVPREESCLSSVDCGPTRLKIIGVSRHSTVPISIRLLVRYM